MSSLPCSSRSPFLASGSRRNTSLTSRHVLLASTRHCLRATLLLIGRRFFFVSFVLLSSFCWWKKFSGAVSCFAAAGLIQWAKVFVEGADKALNGGYEHRTVMGSEKK